MWDRYARYDIQRLLWEYEVCIIGNLNIVNPQIKIASIKYIDWWGFHFKNYTVKVNTFGVSYILHWCLFWPMWLRLDQVSFLVYAPSDFQVSNPLSLWWHENSWYQYKMCESQSTLREPLIVWTWFLCTKEKSDILRYIYRKIPCSFSFLLVAPH